MKGEYKMYEKLTEKFLSMKWDKGYLSKLNTSISEDTIVSSLDNAFPEWTFKITHMISVNDKMCVAGTLFLPGRTIDGTGSNEWSAIYNIISRLRANVNNISYDTSKDNSASSKTTSASIMAELSSIKAKTELNNSEESKNDTDFDADAKAIFDELLDDEKQKESDFIEFGTPEAEAHEKEFWNQINKAEALKTPTAEEVNPGHVFMKPKWTTETGAKLQNWMKTHNITTKEQMTSWFMRYCGLEYDFFNPEWLDKFIAWTDALREQQTY